MQKLVQHEYMSLTDHFHVWWQDILQWRPSQIYFSSMRETVAEVSPWVRGHIHVSRVNKRCFCESEWSPSFNCLISLIRSRPSTGGNIYSATAYSFAAIVIKIIFAYRNGMTSNFCVHTAMGCAMGFRLKIRSGMKCSSDPHAALCRNGPKTASVITICE